MFRIISILFILFFIYPSSPVGYFYSLYDNSGMLEHVNFSVFGFILCCYYVVSFFFLRRISFIIFPNK